MLKHVVERSREGITPELVQFGKRNLRHVFYPNYAPKSRLDQTRLAATEHLAGSLGSYNPALLVHHLSPGDGH